MTHKHWPLAIVAAAMTLITSGPAAPITVAAPQTSPAKPAIAAVSVQEEKRMLEQTCPVVLVFHGDITTTRPVTVTWAWVDSRGRTWPEHHRKFTRTGVQAVTHKWKVGRPKKTVDAWVQLKVIAPESKASNKVPVNFTCQ
jgi:hypothetical protein